MGYLRFQWTAVLGSFFWNIHVIPASLYLLTCQLHRQEAINDVWFMLHTLKYDTPVSMHTELTTQHTLIKKSLLVFIQMTMYYDIPHSTIPQSKIYRGNW